MMQIKSVLRIHDLLHSGQVGERRDNPGQLFTSAARDGLRFVTQNLRKPTENTDWVKADPEHRKLTWIFENGHYAGKVQEQRDPKTNEQVTKVFKFRTSQHAPIFTRRK